MRVEGERVGRLNALDWLLVEAVEVLHREGEICCFAPFLCLVFVYEITSSQPEQNMGVPLSPTSEARIFMHITCFYQHFNVYVTAKFHQNSVSKSE